MLSPADAELASREPEIPGFSTVLEPEALLRALAEARPQLQPLSAVLNYLHYEPGKRVVAAYDLECRDRMQTAYAVASRRDQPVETDGPVAEQSADGRAAADACIQLEELAIRFCVFPYDSRLRALPRLADPRSRRRLFSRLLPGRPDLHDTDIEPVRYKPERRFIGRLRSAAGDDVALKFYRRRNFETAKRNAALLRSGGALRFPKWLGDSDRLRITAVAWVPGPLLRDAFSRPKPDLAAVTLTAAALTEFHAQEVSLPRRSSVDTINKLRASAGLLDALLPAYSADTAALIHRLTERLSRLPELEATVHGDFYGKQVILGEDHATLIDLDTAARGHPLEDVGLFLAHLERDEALGRIFAERALVVRNTFLEGYRRARGLPLPEGVDAYTASSLMRLAAYPFRTFRSDWPGAVEGLLRRASELAEV